MNLFCRLGFHRWRYHDNPVSIRICAGCYLRQHLNNNEWS